MTNILHSESDPTNIEPPEAKQEKIARLRKVRQGFVDRFNQFWTAYDEVSRQDDPAKDAQLEALHRELQIIIEEQFQIEKQILDA